jgi:hypothetical protein
MEEVGEMEPENVRRCTFSGIMMLQGVGQAGEKRVGPFHSGTESPKPPETLLIGPEDQHQNAGVAFRPSASLRDKTAAATHQSRRNNENNLRTIPATMKLIVTGSTGLVGSALVRQCLASDQISHVVALSRRPLTLPEDITKSPKLTVILHDDFLHYPPELVAQLAGAEGCLWWVYAQPCPGLDS